LDKKEIEYTKAKERINDLEKEMMKFREQLRQ
jgi:hypothetical protein